MIRDDVRYAVRIAYMLLRHPWRLQGGCATTSPFSIWGPPIILPTWEAMHEQTY